MTTDDSLRRASELLLREASEVEPHDLAARLKWLQRETDSLPSDNPLSSAYGQAIQELRNAAFGRSRRLTRLTGFVAEWMKPAYPELLESVQRVARIVKDEEHRYATTFQVAEKVFQDEVKAAQKGVLHRNAAARYKSRLTIRVSQAAAARAN